MISSRNSDVRALGSFLKPIEASDLNYLEAGGVPAVAVITFIGYGIPAINVLRVGPRLVLNNGFHRVYALRSAGVSHIPVVVQNLDNPQLELPPHLLGVPTPYLFWFPAAGAGQGLF